MDPESNFDATRTNLRKYMVKGWRLKGEIALVIMTTERLSYLFGVEDRDHQVFMGDYHRSTVYSGTSSCSNSSDR
jgi:hypothetical protein